MTEPVRTEPALPVSMPGSHQDVALKMLRRVGAVLSPAGRRARLSVLIYHRVLAAPDPLLPEEMDAALFATHMAALTACFNVLPLPEALERLRRGALPARAACVTFDDGYADNFNVALPILRHYRVAASFFIATGYLGSGCMWNDAIVEAVRRAPGTTLMLAAHSLGDYPIATPVERGRCAMRLIAAIKHLPDERRRELTHEIVEHVRASIPPTLMMQPSHVQALRAAGMDVGAHTVTHPMLTRVDIERARQEIADSRDYLQGLLREPVNLFAYPNGRPHRDYAAEHVALVRELGFSAAVSTAHGTADHGWDMYQIPRFTPWDRTARRFVARLLLNCTRRDIEHC